jgi:thiosulfate/3-mercaptopyruvate sulfurtransferase
MRRRTGSIILAVVVLMIIATLFLMYQDQFKLGRPSQPEAYARMLVQFSDVKSYDVILDVSPSATKFIPGAINLNYERLFNPDKKLRSDQEIAKILGDAGISREDAVVVYGECQPCGGGPSAAAYMYWVMRYLGQDNLGLLDGGIRNWTDAGLPTTTMPSIRAKTVYTPIPKPELMATYSFVNNSQAQIVDTRTPEEFRHGSIPSAINIPYDAVLENGRLQNSSSLSRLFAGLDKDRPVVAFSATGVKASVVCCALDLLGYKSSIYSWNDWIASRKNNTKDII